MNNNTKFHNPNCKIDNCMGKDPNAEELCDDCMQKMVMSLPIEGIYELYSSLDAVMVEIEKIPKLHNPNIPNTRKTWFEFINSTILKKMGEQNG
jgi:hypothetical protein